MPIPPSEIAEVLLQWLREQSFTPQPRSIQLQSNTPSGAYPCLTVQAVDERFTQAGTDSALTFVVSVECAAGRLGDAQTQVRLLARQVRSALHRSHGLAGAVQRIITAGIDYTRREGPGAPVVARAELHLTMLLCE